MIQATKTLILRDYELSLTTIINKLSIVNTDNSINLSETLASLFKQKIILQDINKRAKSNTISTISQIYKTLQPSNEHTIKDLLNFSIELTNYSKTLNKSHSQNKIVHNTLSDLQDFLSKLRLINLALQFFDFLGEHSVECFHYSIFIDFRGRVYYKSPCSPQAY